MMRVSRARAAENGGMIDIRESPTAVTDSASGLRVPKAPPNADREFRELVRILRRRFRLVAAVAIAGAILAAIVGLMISPRYIAMAQIMIEPPNAGERPARAGDMDETVDTHLTLLRSRDHLQRVIDSLRQDFDAPPRRVLAAGPVSVPVISPSNPNVLETPSGAEHPIMSMVKQRSSIWLTQLWSARRSAVPDIDEFERDTKVIQERKSRIISVAYASSSPEKAAAFVNRIVQLYIENLGEHRLASTASEMARLHDRIVEAKSEMDKAGLAVQRAMQELLSEQDANAHATDVERPLQNLERAALASAQVYGGLLRRQKEMRAQQEVESGGVLISSRAEIPDRPSSHNPLLFIVPAFFIFAIGGGWIAVALDKLDRGLRSEKATAEALGIPCIGLVPRIPRKCADRPYEAVRKEPFSAYSEALRSAVTTLQLVEPDCMCKVLLVTSSVPGEGKTSLASALAGYVAALGRRVLLIDFDLRSRPTHHEKGAKLEREGTDQPFQNQALTEIIGHLPEGGPNHLSVAHHQLDPLAPFAKDCIRHLVQQQREKYDCVLIDGPPVLGAAETRLLCPAVDQVLYVVKWDDTKQEVAQNALDLLRHSGCLDTRRKDFAVAILTQVNLKKHARYEYGDAGQYLGRNATRRQSIRS